MKESVLLINSDATSDLQKSLLGKIYNFIPMQTTDEALKVCKDKNQNIVSIVLGSDIKDPIQTSQRIYALDKSLSVIILAHSENLSAIRKSIMFTPFINSGTVCIPDSSLEELITQLQRLVESVIKHRESKKIAEKFNNQLLMISHQKNKPSHSKDYIERLFDAAPIGIMTLDKNGEILALNESSSQMFGVTEAKSIGLNINVLFPDLILIPDRVEEISKKLPNGTVYLQLTITTITGSDGSTGYLLMFVDITQRKKYESDLRKAIMARDEFLSIASHELKTPITSLKIQLQMSERTLKKVTPPSVSEILSKSNAVALKQVDRLIKLVEDLLDVSKIEAGRLSLNLEETNLTTIVQELIQRLCGQAELADCEVNLEAPKEMLLTCDPYRIDQVVTNLLINAFKYASNGPVKVQIIDDGSEVIIVVSDKGPGIEKEKLPLIFNRFERAISHANISGLGLGLYISKTIIEAHGGTIDVESTIGKGSKFTVRIPKN